MRRGSSSPEDLAASLPNRPLEPNGRLMSELARHVEESIVSHLEALGERPAADTDGGVELARSLRLDSAPSRGRPLAELLDLLFDRAIPKGFGTTSPGYMAYIPGGGLYASALAAFIAAATNRYTGLFAAAPALVELESNVLRWFRDWVGYPPSAAGILTSGGSLANFTALVTARRDRLGEDFQSAVIYASSQTHHSVAKAAGLAGFRSENVRPVPVDERFRLMPSALASMIAEDRSSKLDPFLVVGNAGTTNSGAIDPLDALAAVAEEEHLWFHVDAAYGGFFVLTEQGQERLAGLSRADSIVLDPHKGLFLPYGTGCLLVRDGQALRAAHRSSAIYLPKMQEEPDLVDFCELSPELSRPYRGLQVWLPLMLYGVDEFRRALDEKLDLAVWATDRLREIPEIEILAEPQLSIVAFAVRPKGDSEEDTERANEQTRTLLAAVNRRQRVHLTGTMLRERFAIRICILSFRTHREHVAAAIEDIRTGLRQARD